MLISTKGRYGLRSLADLVYYGQKKPVPLRVIAERQGISESYLEQVFALLRKAGLVNAVRGSYGGYVLARPAHQITVGEVLKALEGPLTLANCTPGGSPAECDKMDTCLTMPFWQELSAKIDEVLSSTTLQDLVKKGQTTGKGPDSKS
ncbi:RrF2 family transcriptional regulator [Capillibacterium thermochitinicola]|uniref:Rrf2 family transcriptional regulator n=1 Tax=Capillibacterium thermochitinicola TaxID=2699427 RepID=A0A8J6I0K9_9FIRM|nr:Rrf2 family transcriptional regulator [Capillibacterium thermochitinicola]MBA2133063.1 Rrf2 family transcriptional regulator [Capillibacterium thermochitinicola]